MDNSDGAIVHDRGWESASSWAILLRMVTGVPRGTGADEAGIFTSVSAFMKPGSSSRKGLGVWFADVVELETAADDEEDDDDEVWNPTGLSIPTVSSYSLAEDTISCRPTSAMGFPFRARRS